MKQTGKFCEYRVRQNHTVVISFVQNRGSRVISSYCKVIHALGHSSSNGKLLWENGKFLGRKFPDHLKILHKFEGIFLS